MMNKGMMGDTMMDKTMAYKKGGMVKKKGYAKGGVVKAKAGASVPPNRKAKK